MENTFHEELQKILEERQLTLKALYETITQDEETLTYASLYSYLKGWTVPPLQKAEWLLTKLNIKNEKEELTNLVKRSKNESVNPNKENGILHMNLKIKLSWLNLSDLTSEDEIKWVIEQRASSLFASKPQESLSNKKQRNLSKYVAYLIRKDLEETSQKERQDNEKD